RRSAHRATAAPGNKCGNRASWPRLCAWRRPLASRFRTSRRGAPRRFPHVRKRPAGCPAIGDDASLKTADYARLVLLAAIWGGAFIFLRVVAPVLGPAWTAEPRVLLGGLALLAWLRFPAVD